MITTNQFQGPNITPEQMNLLFRLRSIWRDMASWIRAYMVYTLLNSDIGLQQAAERILLMLPEKYGNVFRLYFGDKVANDYAALLLDYINHMISLIDAVNRGDTSKINAYVEPIYKNVDNRAGFLSEINPYWQKEVLENYFNSYTNMTIDEMNTFINKDYIKDIDLYNTLLSYSDEVGDYIADGLVKYYASSRTP